MTRLAKMAMSLDVATAEEGVERDAMGIPVAFRIWRAGANTFDGGELFFTQDSADALMTEQASRARPYSIDFDHLSLSENRPAEAGRASGYHTIEVRNGELWAANVEWCADVREGLAEKPPRWRYFSPAFKHSEDYEVTSYINLALCINPLTHGIPLLASHKAATNASRNGKALAMTVEEQLAALDAMIEAEGDADKKAVLEAARAALASKGDGDAVEETAAEGEDKDPPPPPADEDEDKKKKTAATAETAEHAADGVDNVTALAKRVVELERRDEVAQINGLLSKHSHLPAEFAAHCRGLSLKAAKVAIDAVVGAKTHAARKAAPSQGGTNAASGLSPAGEAAMDRAMGMTSPTAMLPRRLEDGRFVMHNIRPSDLARLNAQKAKA